MYVSLTEWLSQLGPGVSFIKLCLGYLLKVYVRPKMAYTQKYFDLQNRANAHLCAILHCQQHQGSQEMLALLLDSMGQWELFWLLTHSCNLPHEGKVVEFYFFTSWKALLQISDSLDQWPLSGRRKDTDPQHQVSLLVLDAPGF